LMGRPRFAGAGGLCPALGDSQGTGRAICRNVRHDA